MQTLEQFTQTKIKNPKTKLDYELLLPRAKGRIDDKLLAEFGRTFKPQVGKQYTLWATDNWHDLADDKIVVEVVEKVKGNKYLFKVISGVEQVLGHSQYYKEGEYITQPLKRTIESKFQANLSWYVNEYDEDDYHWRTTIHVYEQYFVQRSYFDDVLGRSVRRTFELRAL